MKILVFEWLVGGGLLAEGEEVPALFPALGAESPLSALSALSESPSLSPLTSLLAQGAQMAVAAASDFAQAGRKVVLPVDYRLTESQVLAELSEQVDVCPVQLPEDTVSGFESLRQRIQALAETADRVLVIAPETNGLLEQAIEWIESEKRIGPDRDFVSLTSHKPRLNSYLLEHQFAHVPEQWSIESFKRSSALPDCPIVWPVVLKPIDGAGSDSTWLVSNASSFFKQMESIEDPERFFVQRFVAGHPISVSVIAGNENIVLPPTRQLFDAHPFGHYVGSQFPIPTDLAERASKLATKLLTILPATTGYFGIDMVLSNTNEMEDSVIEVNPRLTMSYSKLREIVDFNLADAILDNTK